MQNAKKQTLQSQREFFSAFYGDSYCECGCVENVSLEEINEAIVDCKMMIQYSTRQGDKEEISFWRKMLQENKVERRRLLDI